MSALKGRDLVVCAWLAGRRGEEWDYPKLVEVFELSLSSLHRSLARLDRSGLFSKKRGTVRVGAFLEFAVHAAKYVFPPVFGPPAKGMPTGPSAPPLVDMLVDASAAGEVWVWPFPEGRALGTILEPLSADAPRLAQRHPELYRRLAVLDVLRAGRARERELATTWLEQELGL